VSQANVDLVRDGLEQLAKGGLESMIDLIDPEVEVLAPNNPDMQRITGHEELRRSLAGLLEQFEYWTLEPVEYIDLGDHVAVTLYQHARGKGSGATVQTKSVWLFTLRNDKAVRVSMLPDTEAAVAEARTLQSFRQ
jgi:ketosteroid isomerase-like protein